MKRWGGLLAIPVLFFTANALCADTDTAPNWAYPVNPPNVADPKDDGTVFHVPGSEIGYTRTQILSRFNVPDWHPEDHPAMPAIVAKGREPQVRACAYCHQPSGVGRPENANLTGLPAAYMKEQIKDFQAGKRKGSEPHRNPMNLMNDLAKQVTEADMDAAIAYFTALKPVSLVHVVEATTSPKWTVSGSMLMPAPGGGTEALGNRLIEVPEDATRVDNRDPRTPFIAYAPPGSVKKGEMLVTAGGSGKTIQCAICHGSELKGIGDVPRIVGLSPSYVIRQLYDIQHGTRDGTGNALMKQVVAKLDQSDMVAISAYLATKQP